MALVAIDVDDTLYDFCAAARRELVNWTGPDTQRAKQAAYALWSDWRLAGELCDGFWLDVIAKVHGDESILRQEPFLDAAEVVTELAQRHELLYISTRDPKCHEATSQWLANEGFPKGDLICTFESKIPHTRDCQFIIDDRPKTLVQFVYDFHWKHKHGSENPDKKRLGFGLHCTSNLSLTDVPDLYLAPTWALLRHYLADKGGLLDG
jgi:hypothetical protein